jgi:hypothetical protein
MLSTAALRSAVTDALACVLDESMIPAAFVMFFTTTSLTVEMKVASICSSMVLAPVSVTLGATAFFFSFT